jgi:hypothetical protein
MDACAPKKRIARRDRCPPPTLIEVDEQHRPIGTVFWLEVRAALARFRVDGAGG